jgi:hypothetical protein
MNYELLGYGRNQKEFKILYLLLFEVIEEKHKV